MTQALIRRALESALNTWAAAQSPAIEVAWENLTFTPPTGRYLRAYLLPANTQSRDIGGVNRNYKGLFQISIYTPLNVGAAPAEELAQAIAALYPVATPLVVGSLIVYITKPLSPGPSYPDPDDSARFITPCSAAYVADTY